MSQTQLFALQGLSCMNCAKKVKTALEARPDVEVALLNNPRYAKVTGDADAQTIVSTVEQAGYHATLAGTPDVTLALSGLSCGHCTASVTKALEAVAGVDAADVSLAEAKIYGSADATVLIEAVKAAGYEAALAQGESHPKTEPLTQSASNSTTATQAPETLAAAETSSPAIPSTADTLADTDDNVQLLLDGMSCASCVLKVQNALQGVPGVEQARVNLAERSALVTGHSDPQALIQAVEKAGYGAEIIQDEEKRRARQQESAEKSVKKFRWQAALGLGLGVPLMAWGLFGGSMELTATNQNNWLIVGLITLGVMVFAGGHFYRNAWRSLMNGSATMDTLVALGTGAAWLYSITVTLWPQVFPMEARHLYYEASAMIIGLINLGHAMEARARQRSSKALERLLDLTPPTARVVTEEGEKTLPLADVKLGMTLRLTTGDRVPVDGEIISGEVWMDEAMLTGEPIPQQKSTGDQVHAVPWYKMVACCFAQVPSAAKPRWRASSNWFVRRKAASLRLASWLTVFQLCLFLPSSGLQSSAV